MAESKQFWRDDEIVVDRDGIPHFTGAKPELMKEYRRRVLFAYNTLEGSGDDEAKEKRSLEKKRGRFAKKLLDALHGEAWKSCQDLLANPEKLRGADGYKQIFSALQSIEKVGVIKKTEAFDIFFDRSYRRRGQSIDSFLRARRESWNDLKDLAEGVSMSEDLLAYFLLKNANLSREDRRQILLANQSDYGLEGIEKALRVSFFDVHEKEKTREWQSTPGRKGQKGSGRRPGYAHAVGEGDQETEDEQLEYEEELSEDYALAVDEGDVADDDASDGGSDQGASNDDAVFEAYSSYRDARKKLKETQKARGFTKPQSHGGGSSEDRRAAIEKEKSRSRCSACNRLGHWAGDPQCPKSGQGQTKGSKGGKGQRKGDRGGRTSKGRAYLTGESPMFFSLRDDDNEEAHCNMIYHQDSDSSGDNEMAQDAGRTELDDKRKPATHAGYTSDWLYVEPPFSPEPGLGHPSLGSLEDAAKKKKKDKTATKERKEEQMVIKIAAEDIEETRVLSLASARPVGLNDMKVRELQADCDRWGVRTSGTKEELRERLNQLYAGEAVLKKGCSKRRIRLVEAPPGPSSSRIFRSYGSSSSAAAPSTSYSAGPLPMPTKEPTTKFSDDLGPTVDPRTGLYIPEGMAVGNPVREIRCDVCDVAMVLRRRRDGLGYFFGCGNFPGPKQCGFTRRFDEGVALYRAAKGSQ
eukprot:s217_g1.t1